MSAAPAADRADVRRRFAGKLSFKLDGFQVKALDLLDEGANVLVAAPTGSGKTIVAEYGIAAALADGRRAFYTAPIKALSNQKFHELTAIHGPSRVGLLTGDHAINAEAPVVVMTTEVLRNMIYARSDALATLGLVVLDEVHFLQDTYRGPVWEEVIIHLPTEVRLVCLSATVSNATELADWVTTVRGRTEAVVEHTRPVRLDQLFMFGDRAGDRLQLVPTLLDGRPNPEVARLDHQRSGKGRGSPSHQRGRRPLYTPSRVDVVERLAEQEMLPAIYFIFSRSQCDDAARSVAGTGIRLTTASERERIRAIIAERVAVLDDDDLDVLGYRAFAAQLEAGVAAHHAGMVPPFKEAVEACFAAGLVKVVFATETLAVGINMPARTVVIEKLSKFTGERHTLLTAGEYTQLTGRAGRRGIDNLGHAIVLWNPFVGFDEVASLATSRSFHLLSAFRPTYNMAANLIGRYTRDEAQRLLNLSFAQYQADGDLVRIEARLRRREAQMAEVRAAAESPFGDIEEFRALRQAERVERHDQAEVEQALDALRPGDVIDAYAGPKPGRVVVLTVANRRDGIKVQVLTTQRETASLGSADFAVAPQVVARLELPVPFAPNRVAFRRDLARQLDRVRGVPGAAPGRASASAAADHPVARDPELRRRLERLANAERIGTEITQLRARIERRERSVARDFERVVKVLAGRNFVHGWSLTADGRLLGGLFHECDLLIAESIRAGHLDGLDAGALAALVSVFVYEHRTPEPPPAPWFPSGDVRQRWQAIERISADLRRQEERAGLNPHRPPDPTYVAIAYAWAAGEGFAEVVEAEDLSGGDFVRTIRQLLDLLRQIAIVAPLGSTRSAATRAAELLHRGVVAASLPVPMSTPGGSRSLPSATPVE